MTAIEYVLARLRQVGQKVWAAMAGAALLFVIGWQKGRSGVREKLAKETAKRSQSGTEATNRAARSGKTPEEIAREGDGRW